MATREGPSESIDSDNGTELTHPEVPGYGDTEEEDEGDHKPSFWRRLLRRKSEKEVRETGDRETWGNKVEFMLVVVGYAISLANVWRFPYLCAKHGGGAFLIPFVIMLFLIGVPLFYLELLLGQSTRRGPIGAWLTIMPNLAGVGIAAVVVIVYISVYYNVIIGWVLFYFVNSFHNPLPWAYCYGYDTVNTTLSKALEDNLIDNLSNCYDDSAKFYLYDTALRASNSIGSAGAFNWQMFLAILVAWVAVYLCLFRGIKWTGKVVYFTVICPYVLLFCLLIRVLTLDGAGYGLRHFFFPDRKIVIEKVFSPQVWLDAATQVIFSLGVATGTLTALASYSKPNYNALKNTFIVCFADFATSICSAILVFSIIGFVAENTGTHVHLVTEGPALALVVFSKAVTLMPLPALWAVLFFVMMFLLGVDTQFAAIEELLTVIRDNKHTAKIRTDVILGVLCFLMFAIGIPYTFGNGIYLYHLFDQFAGNIPLLLIALIEFFAIGWVVGVDRFFDEICKVKRHHYIIHYLWTVLWMFVNPILMLVILLGAIVMEFVNPLEYTVWKNNEEVLVEFPSWAQFLGAVIILSSVLPIPAFLIGRLIFLESAREEAREFFRAKVNQFKRVYDRLRCRRPASTDEEPLINKDRELTNSPSAYELQSMDSDDNY